MKTRMRFFKKKTKLIKTLSVSLTALVSLTFILSSCGDYHGHDGYPGRAYLALHWEEIEPDYLDAGTSDIPSIFTWGEYYRTRPGVYTFYYEGEDWNGYKWIPYAWEVDYEIWINLGEPGGDYYDGADGMDNFFSIVCSPFGPDVLYDGASYKKAPGNNDQPREMIEVGETITIIKQDKDMKMKVTYKRVEPRKKTS